MALPVDPEVYRTLDRATPALFVWLTVFVGLTLRKLARRAQGLPVATHEGTVASELPGLPLMLLHSVGFALSLWRRDLVSTLLFAWWGPGYLLVASLMLLKVRVDWR